ncbi:uncharacterized protein [Bemisia tabaci]|uniref:uncharacterized protein n=1 Tax=Bemisia tabaci TaxID=7038 RepID=UPI003B28B8B1
MSSNDTKDKYRLTASRPRDVIRPRPLSHLELLGSESDSENEEEDEGGGGGGEEGKKDIQDAAKKNQKRPGRRRVDPKNPPRRPLAPKNPSNATPGRKDLAELRADKLFLLKYGRESLPDRRPVDRPRSTVETIENLARSNDPHPSGLTPQPPVNPARRTPVRSKSWLSERDWRLEGGFLRTSRSDYERALSSLLWQPYECRSETTTSRNLDDSDVSYWLNSPSTWSRDPRDSTSSLDSLSSTDSERSLAGVCRERGHDSTSSSLCGLINSPTPTPTPDYRFHGAEWTGLVNDPRPSLPEPPQGALRSATGSRRAAAGAGAGQSEPRSRVGATRDALDTMLVNVEPSANGSESVDTCSSSSVSVVPGKFSVSDINCDLSASPANVCYRAVPATVSAVPSILCQNSSNVSNVRVESGPAVAPPPPKPRVSVSTSNIYIPPTSTNSPVYTLQSRGSAELVPSNAPETVSSRTFTSTEAQTDDVLVNPRDANREQRRRERRERRHQQRRLMNSLQRSSLPPQDPHSWPPQTQVPPESERLPDILNSHLPPPYSTLPPVAVPVPVVTPPAQFPLGAAAPPNVSVLLNSGPVPSPSSPQHPQTPSIASGFRLPFAIVPNSRRRRDCMNVWSNWTQEMRSRFGGRESHYTPEEEPKSCCGVSLSQTLAIRWFILVVFFLGLCCAVVGSVLGVMRISGREHLTVSILMIGVGIVLVAVSGVAWRMTSRDAPSCRVMLGLGAGEEGIGEPNRRFVPRLPPTYGRPHHPYAAMMYPEFQYRAPPPSYQASMQEYRLRLLLLDRNNGPLNTVSPPPTYRSHPGTILRPPINCRRDPICHPPNLDYSRPPSYRSRTSSTRPSCNLDPTGDIGGSISTTHSRNPSQLSISDAGGNTVNVITVIGTRSASDTDSENIIKMVPDESALSGPLSIVSSKKESDADIVKDAPSNIVTIVQSAPETNGSVIVTVTGTTTDTTTSSHTCDTEMQILAHL